MTNNELMVQEGLVTIEGAMDFLDISRASLYRLINDGTLPTVKLIGARRIPRRALIDLAASRVIVGTPSSN
jgi:predicted DNA-binding transcriptional regulator AlpA